VLFLHPGRLHRGRRAAWVKPGRRPPAKPARSGLLGAVLDDAVASDDDDALCEALDDANMALTARGLWLDFDARR
jgi:hypothetical protein